MSEGNALDRELTDKVSFVEFGPVKLSEAMREASKWIAVRENVYTFHDIVMRISSPGIWVVRIYFRRKY